MQIVKDNQAKADAFASHKRLELHFSVWHKNVKENGERKREIAEEFHKKMVIKWIWNTWRSVRQPKEVDNEGYL